MLSHASPAGRVLLQDTLSFSVAGMASYVDWVDASCATAETETCSVFISAAGGGVRFPASSTMGMAGQERVEFQTSSGVTVLQCTTAAPPQCEVAVEGPLKGKYGFGSVSMTGQWLEGPFEQS